MEESTYQQIVVDKVFATYYSTSRILSIIFLVSFTCFMLFILCFTSNESGSFTYPNITFSFDNVSFTSTGQPLNISDYRGASSNRLKVAILQVDDRPNFLFDIDSTQDNAKSATFGLYYHNFYSRLHGYSYIHVNATSNKRFHKTWTKISALSKVLNTKKYDLVVLIDTDAFVTDLEVPIENMLKYWKWSDKALMLMAEDPYDPTPHNRDSYNRTTLNTGFIIVANTKKSRDIVNDWSKCWKNQCSRWALDFSHEQRSFSEFYRDKFKGDELIVAECNSANGGIEVPWCDYRKYQYGGKGFIR